MRSTRWQILFLSLVISSCAHGDVPKVNLYFNDPIQKGFERRKPDGKKDFVSYDSSESLKIQGFEADELAALVQYYNAQIKFWKTKAENCQTQTP